MIYIVQDFSQILFKGGKMEIELFTEIENKYTPDILLAMSEIQQSRSDFQIEKFVIGQHDTEEMRYVQTIIELQHLYYTVKEITLKMKKTEIEIQRLRSTGDEIDEIDAQIKELGLEHTRLIGVGTFREIEKLLQIYNSFPTKYTRQEIEQGQIEYWSKRLNRQATMEAIGGSQAQASHLDSLRQIGAIKMNENGGIEISDDFALEHEKTMELQ